MTVIGRFQVSPGYHQVTIRDVEAAEYPQWENPEEESAVATAQCIAVGTRGDHEGDVTIEVRRGAERPGSDGQWHLAYNGELLLTGEDVLVGSYLGSGEEPVRLGIGWHPVQIFVRPKDGDIRPAEVLVIFDANPPS